MKPEWNESQRLINIQKHGIDFDDSETLFSGPTLTVVDERLDYGKQRFVKFGLLSGCVVAVCHTETTDSIRIISIRKATKREQAFFVMACKTELQQPNALRDEDIDLSDVPEVTPEMFSRAIVHE